MRLLAALALAVALLIAYTPTVQADDWQTDPEISWYGPGLYGHRTACGLKLTKELRGVAHRTLPCGTLVEFRFEGRTLVVPIVDRGPYVNGRQWDLTRGACMALSHCFTGRIEWRFAGQRPTLTPPPTDTEGGQNGSASGDASFDWGAALRSASSEPATCRRGEVYLV